MTCSWGFNSLKLVEWFKTLRWFNGLIRYRWFNGLKRYAGLMV